MERIDLGTGELNQLLERARELLSEEDYRKLKAAVDTLEYLTELVADKDTTIRHLRQLLLPASTEKTKDVLAKAGAATANPTSDSKPESGQEQTKDEAIRTRAHRRRCLHWSTAGGCPPSGLKHGDRCPERGRATSTGRKNPRCWCGSGSAVGRHGYSLERLRCGACGQVFTAEEPDGVGPEKYDETASAMIAQLKYGSGTPFYRLEQLERHLGIPLPAATQWEIVEETAEVIKPARDELFRQAAQGEVLHNDDTGMRVLRLAREAGDQRTGVFTSGIVATMQGRQIALYFTGPKHAGENLADVLKRRAAEFLIFTQLVEASSPT
jgi:hypothetical protein